MLSVRSWLIVLGLLLFPLSAFAVDGKCLSCHEGIEKISEVAGMVQLSCTDCHKGDANAPSLTDAHQGMYANPSDYRVVDEICGPCHQKIIDNSKKSLHATMAGKISGTRYAWGAQGREAIYATYAIEDADPQGEFALKSLEQLPTYDPKQPEGAENNPGDDYLRQQCLRCHVWNRGFPREGDYRASGCAACHVIYSDAGTYEGGDKAIDKAQKERPRLHRITNKIPEYQCIHCHNRGGRTGVSFIGTIESAGYGSPWTDKGQRQERLHGQNYDHLVADIHYDKGLVCIDCHTVEDLHGDGNIYAKREQEVKIECENCHGTINALADLKTIDGDPLPNIRQIDGQVVQIAKLTGKEHVVPQISELDFSREGQVAMQIVSSHMDKLECYACHATWAPQCYGCHAKQDISVTSGDWLDSGDWMSGRPNDDPSKAGHLLNRKQTAYSWMETRSYLRWENPSLGVNTEGKVAPFVPGCQVFFTQMDGDRNIVNNKVFTTVDGTSGLGHNPMQPHTVTKQARPCMECHATRKALGLGSGIYDIERNFPDGAPVDFELERMVDEEGNQLQEIAHERGRPFTKEEMQRISMVGTCDACHGLDPVFWAEMMEERGIDAAPTDALHSKAIRILLERNFR